MTGPLPWMAHGLCLGDTSWTDATHHRQHAPLIEVCRRCPVLARCAGWAATVPWSGSIVIAAWVAPAFTGRARNHPGPAYLQKENAA